MPGGRKTNEDLHNQRLEVARLSLAGLNQSQISKETGLDRKTVRSWLTNCSVMSSMLSEVKEETLRQTAGEVAKLLPDAFEAVRHAIVVDKDAKVAMQLLTACGALASGGKQLGMSTAKDGEQGERVAIVVNIEQGTDPHIDAEAVVITDTRTT